MSDRSSSSALSHPTVHIRFEAHRSQLRQNGVLETDLPFLLEAPQARVGLLLLHGSAASPCNHRELAYQLHTLGYTVIAGLLAGHDQMSLLQAGHTTWQDCYRSAVDYLTLLEELVPHTWVIGSSFGGSLAYLMGVDIPERLDGIIALSAPAITGKQYTPTNPWMIQVEGAIRAVEQHIHRLHLPTLVMHGVDDPFVKVKNAYYAYEQMPTARKKLLIYNQIGHSLGFGYNTSEVTADIHTFIHTQRPPRQVRFELPDYQFQTVDLVGDFTNWQHHLPLQRHGKFWQISLLLPPGRHQYKFVVNGQDWILDPDGETIMTPHGQQNSCVVVK